MKKFLLIWVLITRVVLLKADHPQLSKDIHGDHHFKRPFAHRELCEEEMHKKRTRNMKIYEQGVVYSFTYICALYSEVEIR